MGALNDLVEELRALPHRDRLRFIRSCSRTISSKDAFSGIYAIVCATSERIYIGSSEHVRKRKNCHLSALRRGRHINNKLQRTFNKYAEHTLKFILVEVWPAEGLPEREQAWLDILWGDGHCLLNVYREAYGVRGKNHPMFGKTHALEAREKIRARRRGQIICHSPETRARIGLSNLGKVQSDATRRQISESRKGTPAWNKGLTADDPRVAKHQQPRMVLSKPVIRTVLDRYGRGFSINSISKELCCSWNIIKRTLSENGIKTRTLSEQKRAHDWSKGGKCP
jgi:group I intron endonuclease